MSGPTKSLLIKCLNLGNVSQVYKSISAYKRYFRTNIRVELLMDGLTVSVNFLHYEEKVNDRRIEGNFNLYYHSKVNLITI